MLLELCAELYLSVAMPDLKIVPIQSIMRT